MIKIFSYCIYGTNKKYCEGMVQNLKQINEHFPDYEIWIYLGNNVPQSYVERYSTFKNVNLIHTDTKGGRLMTYRFFPLNTVNVLFSRDADSRFTERDLWCINKFLESDYKIFTIRDHPWHGAKLMGGMTGFKNFNMNIESIYSIHSENNKNPDRYDSDQKFIEQYIYKNNLKDIIVYTSFHKYNGENVEKIPLPRKDDYDFCGNVIDYDKNGKEKFIFTIRGRA